MSRGNILDSREQMMGDFDGRSAVVTGGASGIGLATATLLAKQGAQVAVLDRVIDDVPAALVPLRCDVTDDASVRSAVDDAAARFGGLDILVNNRSEERRVGKECRDQWLGCH